MKSHPHIVKAVINDAQRRQTLESLRWKLNRICERKSSFSVLQDRIDHIRLQEKAGNEVKIVLEYTIIIVPITFYWERIYGLRADRYTTLDFSNILEELSRIKTALADMAEHPPDKPVKHHVTINHLACKDWVIT
jgi:hypothetical protein